MSTIIVLIINQIILKYQLHYSSKRLFMHSYFPSLIITLLFLPYLFIKIEILSLWKMAIGIVYLVMLMWFVGFSKNERASIITLMGNLSDKIHEFFRKMK